MTRRERQLWGRLGAAYAFWAAAAGVGYLPLGASQAALLVAALRVCGFLSFLLGVELRPELSRRAVRREADPFEAWGALLLTVAFFAYFVYVPALGSPAELASGWPGTFLRGSLDLLLLWRTLALAAAAHPGRWAAKRALLALDVGARGLAVQLSALGVGRGVTLVLVAVGVAAVVVAAVGVRGAERAAVERAAVEPRGTSPSLVVGATLTLPLVHLLVRPFVRQFPETYGLREAVVVAFVVVSGGLAMLQLRRRQRLRDDAERRLEESERRFRGLVDRSADAVLLERDGRLAFANGAAKRLFGLPEDLGAWSLARLAIAPPDADSDPGSQRRVTRGGAPPGGERRLDLVHRRLGSDAAEPGWLLVARDVTALERSREEAERLERLAQLGELAATIAEEMRTPVETLCRDCDALAAALPASGEGAQTAADLRLGADRVRRIVDGLADRADGLAPRRVEIDVVELLEEVLRTAEPTLANAGVRIRRRYAPTPARVAADRDEIAQVFANVLANAAVASRSGGEIELVSAVAGDRVAVEVVDHGSGIAAEDLARVYDPFFTTRPDGTGLGLAIVARILARNGAEHTITSELGKGTRFRVVFPAAVPAS